MKTNMYRDLEHYSGHRDSSWFYFLQFPAARFDLKDGLIREMDGQIPIHSLDYWNFKNE